MNQDTPGNLIIGIGNPFRNDDAAGRHVARRLRGRLLPDVRILECSGEATELMQAWTQAENVLVVDAISSGQTIGSIQRFDASQRSLPVSLTKASTHAFGLSHAIELSRVLKTLPTRLTVYGIEGGNFDPGQTLSSEVHLAIEACCDEIQTTCFGAAARNDSKGLD